MQIQTRNISKNKGGQILTLTDGGWKYKDELYGREPHFVNKTIWMKNKVHFRYVYWGKVVSGINFDDIYAFLRKGLKQGINSNTVHLGPECYIENNMAYTNSVNGDIKCFQCAERIYTDGAEIYTAWFNGGLVDVDKE